MNKHRVLPSIALVSCLLSIISCSKSSTPPAPPQPVPPKYLVAVWHNKGQSNQSGFTYTYDDQGRIVKRSDALDPSSYNQWTYTGNTITNHKAYDKGALVYDLNNSFSTLNGSILEIFYNKDGSGKILDSTIMQYDTSGHDVPYVDVTVQVVNGVRIEAGYQFLFVGTDLGSYINRSAQNGVVSPDHNTIIVKSVDTHLNPFYAMGTMNQILSSYADDWLSKGYHNITSLEGSQMGADPGPGNYTWTYDADGYPVSLRAVGGSVDLVTYVYSR